MISDKEQLHLSIKNFLLHLDLYLQLESEDTDETICTFSTVHYYKGKEYCSTFCTEQYYTLQTIKHRERNEVVGNVLDTLMPFVPKEYHPQDSRDNIINTLDRIHRKYIKAPCISLSGEYAVFPDLFIPFTGAQEDVQGLLFEGCILNVPEVLLDFCAVYYTLLQNSEFKVLHTRSAVFFPESILTKGAR